jgi:hypothetical protein
MRKLITTCFALFLSLSSFAQETEKKEQKIHEINLNFFNTITIASVELGYERFFGGDHSLGVNLYINDRISYYSENPQEEYNPYREEKITFKSHSIGASYNFYFSEAKNGTGYYLSPFFKYRFGEVEKNIKFDETTSINQKMNISSPVLGLGFGYKWVWHEKMAIGLFANIGRNFNNKVNEAFDKVEFNSGVSVGYRF